MNIFTRYLNFLIEIDPSIDPNFILKSQVWEPRRMDLKRLLCYRMLTTLLDI